MNVIKRIRIRPNVKPVYVTTPAALADPVVFVRVNALQLLSWYGVLQEGVDDPKFRFCEFARVQYEREVLLHQHRGAK